MATHLAVCTNRDYCSLGDRRLVLRLSEDEAFFCPECGRVLELTTGGPPGLVVVLRAFAVAALAGIAAASFVVLWRQHPAMPTPHPRATVAANLPKRLPNQAAVKPPAPPRLPAPPELKQPAQRPPAPISVAVRLLVADTSPPPPAPPAMSPYALALTVTAPPELAGLLVPKLLAGFLAAEGIKPRLEQESLAIVNLRFGPDADRQVIAVVPRPSADALAALASNTADIALPDRPLTAPEGATLGNATGQAYASAGTVVVVHLSNNLPGLARRQVAAILDGRITNWSGLKRPDAPLHAYAAQDFATTGAMGFGVGAARLPVGRTLTALPDEAAVLHAVAADPQGIGFITSGMAGGVRPVPLEEAAQSALVRTLSAYVAPAAKPMASRFLAYLQTDDARRIEIGAGFGPPLPTPVVPPAPSPPKPAATKPVTKPPVAKMAAAKSAAAQAAASKPVPPKALANPLPVVKQVVVAAKPTVLVKPHPDGASVTTNSVSPSQQATVPPSVEVKAQAPKAGDKPSAAPVSVAAKPEPVPQSRPEAAKVAAITAAPPSPEAAPAAEAPHQRIVQLPPGSKFTFGPLKDVRMPTMITQRVGQPGHAGGDKPTQGTMQVDCAIDASGVPQDCKLLSALHSGGVSESILSWLSSGAIRYPAKDANGQTAGRRVLTVKFPGQ